MKSIFTEKQYQTNIKDGITIFSPIGSSIGDEILLSGIIKKYEKDNPDEDVILLKMPSAIETEQILENYKPDKLFWCSTTNFLPKPDYPLIEFDLHMEATACAEVGFYSELGFNADVPVVFPALDGKKWVVLHFRNIKKAQGKNTNKETAIAVLGLLLDKVRNKNFDRIVLVGNDEETIHESPLRESVIDLRKKLSLQQIAWMIKNSLFYVGSDSGIAHVAGCCGVPMVSWGYQDRDWFPKVKNRDDCWFFVGENLSGVLQGIEDLCHSASLRDTSFLR